MRLNNHNLHQIALADGVTYSDRNNLSEKVIQFGTGVLLRGLVDYYIDRANRTQSFDGSVVIIKSTHQGDLSVFKEQDQLYSLQTEGLVLGKPVQTKEIITCISRVLTAHQDWKKIEEVARDPAIEFVISNTTELGIVEIEEVLENNVPKSFPGKLTALLYHRFNYFQGSPDSGLIILPTELIEANADKLQAIVYEMAKKNHLPGSFLNWIRNHNHFCNTLVDRIVPGKVNTSQWHYQDELAIRAEPFNLWAIEVKSEKVKQKLRFANANPEIQLLPSIAHIKELKLRLLNATHTLTCPLAMIANQKFVRETLEDTLFEDWIKCLMSTEIKQHLLSQDIQQTEIDDFASALIDRFKNPFIDHKWSSIAQNSSSKWKQRVIPILQSWYAHQQNPPKAIALSLASFLACHTLFDEHEFAHDTQIKMALERQASLDEILADVNIWGINLTIYPHFSQEIEKHVKDLSESNIREKLHKF